MSNGPLQELRGTRIAHLIETDAAGGAERMLASLAAALQAAGCPGIALLPADKEGWLSRELRAAGVPVEYFRLERPVSPACARWLAEALRRHRITLAHSHDFTMAVYGAWATRRASVRHIITLHGGRYYAERLRRRVALRAAASWSAALVTVSRALADHARRDLWLPSARIRVIPNGVRATPVAASTLRDELGLAPGDRIVLSVGNLYPVKGHDVLLAAFALLMERHPRAHLAIAGRGELEEALTHRAAALGCSDRLHLLGLRADVPNLLAGADVFVLPSLSEGLPMALLEAMHAGCPIVATNVGDVAVALADGDAGVLVEPGNVAALAAALDRVLASPVDARAMGRRAGQRAAAEYSLAQMVGRYAELYRAVLGGRRTLGAAAGIVARP